MELPIKLLRGVGFCETRGDVPITDEMSIAATCDSVILDNVYVTLQNNGKTVVCELVDGSAQVPETLKNPGVLKLCFQKIVNGRTLHTWSIPPILLKDVSGTFTAIPQITALEDQVQALTEAVAELRQIIVDNGGF